MSATTDNMLFEVIDGEMVLVPVPQKVKKNVLHRKKVANPVRINPEYFELGVRAGQAINDEKIYGPDFQSVNGCWLWPHR